MNFLPGMATVHSPWPSTGSVASKASSMSVALRVISLGPACSSRCWRMGSVTRLSRAWRRIPRVRSSRSLEIWREGFIAHLDADEDPKGLCIRTSKIHLIGVWVIWDACGEASDGADTRASQRSLREECTARRGLGLRGLWKGAQAVSFHWMLLSRACTVLWKSESFCIRSFTLSTLFITVLWCMLNAFPISATEAWASSRARYMATCLGSRASGFRDF